MRLVIVATSPRHDPRPTAEDCNYLNALVKKVYDPETRQNSTLLFDTIIASL